MFFQSVCWDITSKCNENCLFCYRDATNDELTLEENKVILKRLISNGVGKISFVGGEPLLYKALFDLVEYGKSLDDNVLFSLTTNAVLLADIGVDDSCHVNNVLLRRIASDFDWITFSMDAPTKEIEVSMGRNAQHIARVIALLEYISTSEFALKVKINTVVSKINVNHLIEMIPILEAYKVDRWKLFKFLPSRGIALSNKGMFEISDKSYHDCVNQITAISRLNISSNDDLDFRSTYITINSKGFLSIFKEGNYYLTLNMAEDNYDNVFRYVDFELHNKRRSNYI